jgi:hypothetical protein
VGEADGPGAVASLVRVGTGLDTRVGGAAGNFVGTGSALLGTRGVATVVLTGVATVVLTGDGTGVATAVGNALGTAEGVAATGAAVPVTGAEAEGVALPAAEWAGLAVAGPDPDDAVPEQPARAMPAATPSVQPIATLDVFLFVRTCRLLAVVRHWHKHREIRWSRQKVAPQEQQPFAPPGRIRTSRYRERRTRLPGSRSTAAAAEGRAD